jgi:hypothetical protein
MVTHPAGKRGTPMTITREETISEALALIDRSLSVMQRRELMSTDEVANLLLDVRVVLAAPTSGDAAN